MKILARFSETYRIRNGYGLTVIRNKRELKALISFCENIIREYKECGFNGSSHIPVFKQTIKLYKKTLTKKVNYSYRDLIDYIEDHVAYYWS